MTDSIAARLYGTSVQKTNEPEWNSNAWWAKQLHEAARRNGGSIRIGESLIFTLKDNGSASDRRANRFYGNG